MDYRWTTGLEAQEATEFASYVRNCSQLVKRLKEILHEEEEVLDRKEFLDSDFDDPSWSEKQAFRNGKRASIRNILNLLDMRE